MEEISVICPNDKDHQVIDYYRCTTTKGHLQETKFYCHDCHRIYHVRSVGLSDGIPGGTD